MSRLSPEWVLAVCGTRLGIAQPGKPGMALDLPRAADLPRALAQALSAASALGMTKGARLRLVLDAAHIAVTLSEPVEESLSEAEQGELARHALRAAFGPEMAEGDVRHTEQGPGLPLIVAGLRAGQAEAIRESIEALGAKLVSLAPYLGAAMDRVRRMLPTQGWAALAEPDSIALMRLDHGIRQLVPQPRGVALTDAFHRLALLGGAKPGAVTIHNAFDPLPVESERDGWSWNVLPIGGRGFEPAQAMAANA